MELHPIVKRIRTLGFKTEAYMLAEIANDVHYDATKVSAVVRSNYEGVALANVMLDLIALYRTFNRDQKIQSDTVFVIIKSLDPYVEVNAEEGQLSQTAVV